MSSNVAWKQNLESVEDYIRIRTRKLFSIFNRKKSDELVSVYQRTLGRVPIQSLNLGFNHAEERCERPPTPKQMLEICNEYRPSESWRYNFVPGVDGDGIAVLIDPSAASPAERFLYRPQDCPEGRAFLARLKEIEKSARRRPREPGEEG